ENGHDIHGRYSAENEYAETTPANDRGNRRGADGSDHGNPDASEDGGRSQRKLDVTQQLGIGHAHRNRGFTDRRIDAHDSDDGVPQDRQKRVKNQCQDCRVLADAADDWDWDKEAEKCEAGDGLEDIGNRERDAAEAGAASAEDAESNAQRDGEGGCDPNQIKMLERQGEDFTE